MRISAGDAARASAVFLALAVLVLFSWWTRSLLITTFLAFLFSLPLAWVADYFHEKKVPRSVSILATVALTAGVLTLLGFLLASPLREQTRELQDRLPAALDKVESWLRQSPATLLTAGAGEEQQTPAQPAQQPPAQQQSADSARPQSSATPASGQMPKSAETPQQASTPDSEGSRNQPIPQDSGAAAESQPAGAWLRGFMSKQLSGITGFLFPFVSTTFAVIGGIILVIVMAIYFAIDPRLYRRGLLVLVPERRRDDAAEAMSEIADGLRRWFIARAVAMIAVGVITAGLLSLVGVRAALALGTIAAILEFVPFFGPILAAVPAIAVALVDSPEKALWTVGVFLLIQQIEGNIITPVLLKKRIDIPPALTIFTVAAMGIIFGVLGVLVAEPVVVALLVGFKTLRNGSDGKGAETAPAS